MPRVDDIVFKGYLPSDGKVLNTRNRTNLKTLSEIDSDSIAGILNEDIVLVDVDNQKDADTLLDIIDGLNINTWGYYTTKGCHIFFKNTILKKQYTDTNTALGLHIDIKIGNKNGVYAIRKLNGEMRELIWDSSKGIDEFPYWLLPIKGDHDFRNLKGKRNDTFFTYILSLQRYGFSKEQIRETIRIINKYITSEPLSDKELDVILRDESFKKQSYFDKGKLRLSVFANDLINTYHLCKLDTQLAIYHNGVYSTQPHDINAAMIEMFKDITPTQMSTVYSYCENIIEPNYDWDDPNYIAFKNGIYNIREQKLESFSPDIKISNLINHDYDPNAYSKDIDILFDNITVKRNELKLLLEETIGYTFYRRNELRKMIFLKGDKHNGKSTFLDVLSKLLEGNLSYLDLKDFSRRFSTIELSGKLANINDDIDGNNINDTGMLKRIAAGAVIQGERKGRDLDGTKFRSYVKPIFSCNSIPIMGDGNDIDALLSRMVVIPFDAHFDQNSAGYDPYFKDRLMDETSMSYLINLGLQGLYRLLANKGFSQSNVADEELSEYRSNASPMDDFILSIEEDELYVHPTNKFWSEWISYAVTNGYETKTNIGFNMRVCQLRRVKTKCKRSGKQVYRVYVKKQI